MKHGLVREVVQIPFSYLRHAQQRAIAVHVERALVTIPAQRDRAEIAGALTQPLTVARMMRSRRCYLVDVVYNQPAQDAWNAFDEFEVRRSQLAHDCAETPKKPAGVETLFACAVTTRAPR